MCSSQINTNLIVPRRQFEGFWKPFGGPKNRFVSSVCDLWPLWPFVKFGRPVTCDRRIDLIGTVIRSCCLGYFLDAKCVRKWGPRSQAAAHHDCHDLGGCRCNIGSVSRSIIFQWAQIVSLSFAIFCEKSSQGQGPELSVHSFHI